MKKLLIFLTLLPTTFSVWSQVNVTDSLALVALYNSTGGPNWNYNGNWLTGPVDSWFGIRTEGGRVTEVILPLPSATDGNNMEGVIPPEIGNLTALKYLRLNNSGSAIDRNMLTGDIPMQLGNLTQLQVLDLSSNQLSGSIPLVLTNLLDLTKIDLSRNSLSGPIPMDIDNLSLLEELNLFSNQFTGTLPVEMGNMKNLKILDLSSNLFSGSIPSELANIDNLEFLNLSGDITGSIPTELGQLSNLVYLRLYGDLSGEIPPTIGNLTNLETLMLHDNQLTGNIPRELGNLSNLQTLRLSNNQLTGGIPNELGNNNKLVELDLVFNQLSGPIPAELGNLDSLVFLGLGFNPLTGTIPDELQNLTLLQEFNIQNTELEEDSIPKWIGNLTELRQLLLFQSNLIGQIPKELSSLSNLIHLNLEDNNLYGPIPKEFDNLTSLRRLEIRANKITDLIDFSGFPNMSHLDCASNQLEFDDIEVNIGISEFDYNPQGSTSNDTTLSYVIGEDVQISLSIGGSSNVYQWYKNDSLISGATSDTLILYSISTNDEGIYRLEISNTIATELILYSGNFNLNALPLPSPPLASTIIDSLHVGDSVVFEQSLLASTSQSQVLSILLLNEANFGTTYITDNNEIIYKSDSVNFTTEILNYEICDQFLQCDIGTLNLEVLNDPPMIEIERLEVDAGGIVEVSIAEDVYDPENFSLLSATVKNLSSNISEARIDLETLTLYVDYTGSFFTGVDTFTIEACDISSDCTEKMIRIAVGELDKVVVYNAVSPNGDGMHDFLKIEDLEFFSENEVYIYDRLGQEQWRQNGYSNQDLSKAFTGTNSDGEDMFTGTYYYTISLISKSGKKYNQKGFFVLQR